MQAKREEAARAGGHLTDSHEPIQALGVGGTKWIVQVSCRTRVSHKICPL